MSRFSRWSKLKTDSRKRRGAALPGFATEPEQALPAAPEPATAEPGPDPATEEGASREQEAPPADAAEEEVYPEDLPEIETLDKDSDYSVFMSEKVSDAIRNRALRKLWLSDPVLANLDGLVDYGEDFTDAAMVVKNMQSVYKVGRGMVDYEEEARKKAEALAAREEAEAETEAERVAADGADGADTPAADAEDSVKEAQTDDQEEDAPSRA